MHSNWAGENLQVIRTLMERSAVYRRALAPIMTLAGSIGLIAAVISCFGFIDTNLTFSLFWSGVGAATLAAAFLLARRQALQESEPFWSPPMRRVAQAFLPGFLAGVVASVIFLLPELVPAESAWLLPPVWMVLYGCGMHAAGFFMQRGIRLWGWAFIIGGIAVLFTSLQAPGLQSIEAGHYVMGSFFGVAHLAYGFYLYFTEKRKKTA